MSANLHRLCAGLTLAEKVSLLTGRDFWSTRELARIGLRPIVFSDGPSGIRGQAWDERDPSVNLPSATALAASWDRGVAGAYGAVLAGEAQRKGVDVVLGPTINMHRTPGGGRHFEAFSEDPVLTAELAAAYTEGIQRHGVGATPKHYLCNDFETERYTVDVRVSERALREVYLLAFEKAVTEARAWLVMSAYNAVNGATSSENPLLETPLNDEWGFDGVVVGDWTGVRSLNSARYAQDLVMPGPDGPWGEALVKAVEAGEIDEAVVDRKVLRLLRLAARLGKLDGSPLAVPRTTPDVDPVRFAREAAAEGAVLLENRGVLPIDPSWVRRVLVVGHSAAHPRTQGGGSATVVPAHVVTPLDGIRAAFPAAQVTYRPGPLVENGLAYLAPGRMTNPVTGEPGAHVRFLDSEGEVIHTEERRSSDLVWFGGDAPIEQAATVEVHTRYLPETGGEIRLGVSTLGLLRVTADDHLVGERHIEPVGTDLGAALLAAPVEAFPFAVHQDRPVELKLTLALRRADAGLRNALGFRIGLLPPEIDDERLIADAVAAARDADLVVVVVGSNKELEAEGEDRHTLALPGRQDDLVAALAQANPASVAVVNCGAPMLLPWASDVGAVLQVWFGGQEIGAAVGDLLTGAAEPGGRLPTTWPADEAQVPILRIEPVAGQVHYDEGIHVGYRNWLRLGRTPAYPFGHGLGYTTWALEDLRVPATVDPAGEDTFTVRVRVRNTGDRAGKQVIQLYGARAETAIDRPVTWLAGFATVRLAAGATGEAELDIPVRTFAHWAGGWAYEPGDFTLTAGFSAADRALTATVRVG
ncbi:glycoside hydrolase family 3 C-terminal domain-containing protein [Acrocarpospora macrocephala]|uniref:Glycosyl hydrolase n=1 Tax=Acrocarpospora macrocephala TaxID=150177 RepID=A0A5M3X558_9ACTN|nr:glycoside hydrolase family 3 C-terminal domain-containing protein [Acrocarpospora macrocephala]GES14781.1 glycosyl hydrolase [Acrocarpospora macrocephala]